MKRLPIIWILLLGLACQSFAAAPAPPVFLITTGGAVENQRSLLLDVAVLRFLPKGGTNGAALKMPKAKTTADILAAMNSAGAGEEMYRAQRYLDGWPAQTISFNALEHRPAFLYGSSTQRMSYASYGLQLTLGAVPPLMGSAVEQGLTLTWTGNYAWSTNFISRRVWERMLMGVMLVGQTVGAGFTEEDPNESDGLRKESGGVSLGGLFKRKKNAKAQVEEALVETAEAKPHYLDAIRKEQTLAGQEAVRAGDLLVTPINGGAGTQEIFYLAVRYDWSGPEVERR